jgi:hypothetical protein
MVLFLTLLYHYLFAPVLLSEEAGRGTEHKNASQGLIFRRQCHAYSRRCWHRTRRFHHPLALFDFPSRLRQFQHLPVFHLCDTHSIKHPDGSVVIIEHA